MASGNIILTKNYQEIEANSLAADPSFYWHYKVKYADISGSNNKRIYVKAYIMRTGDENISISSVTLHVKLNGTEKASNSGSASSSSKFSDNGTGIETYFDVPYDSGGTWSNKLLQCWMTGGTARYSSSGTAGSGASSNDRGDGSGYVSLPPVPTGTVASALYQNGFHGYVVAGHSKIQETITFTNTKKIVVKFKKDGVDSATYTIRDTTSGSGTVPFSGYVPPSSASDYSLTVEVVLSNDYGSTTISTTQAVKGYSLPTYSSAAYTVRCNQSGVADSQGEYGKLHLAWTNTGSNPSITPVDTSNRNSLQTLLVKVSRNGTQETLFNGSAPSAGYLDLIFPLAVNVQGDLIVKFTDQIDTNTVTSLVVPKAIMPFAMYQSGDSVGVAFGRMATEEGVFCYLPFYILGDNGYTLYKIHIDSSGNLQVTAQ